jgi:ZIP family zinc transporter
MLGFGAGVMIAASFWSLLNPAIELGEEMGLKTSAWVIPAIGFFVGGIFIVLSEKFLDKYCFTKWMDLDDEVDTDSLKRSMLLIAAVTIHNIPEGMAVGLAFAGVTCDVDRASIISAMLLSLGIALQNFPEGAAVSLPLRREGYSRLKAFFYGQASGMVEPLAGMFGAFAATRIRSLLPFFLSFAAGAMISVVASELIPECASENKNIATVGVILGFIFMMALDVALG